MSRKKCSTYCLRCSTADAGQKAENEHLLLRLSEATCCIEDKVDKVGVLQHSNSPVDFAQGSKYEGTLGIAKQKDCHDQLAHKAFRNVKVI